MIVPGLLLLYAVAKRGHWPGGEASMNVRELVEREVEKLGLGWAVARLVIMWSY